jgi:hypothetical protein
VNRRIYYTLLGIVAAAGLWFVADAPGWWGRLRAGASGFRGPLGQIAETAALGHADGLPCTVLTPEQQDALAYGGMRPAESCRLESADTTVVVLRGADSTVISLIRVWRPTAGRLDAEYAVAGEDLTRTWGESRACPENDHRGASGDRVWSGEASHVRLYKRLPDQLVIDYELGPGGCQIPL